tara:strand:- start:43 stop:510 length:468 start_codon:yes stop_codon:yes gene_type:complete
MKISVFFFVIVFLYLAQVNSNEIIHGKVIHIADGDTVNIKVMNEEQRIRLAEIDAPEAKQVWGAESIKALKSKILNEFVTIQVIDTDRYGRKVAVIFFNDVNINSQMVAEGHAWVYREYSTSSFLLELERIAQEKNIGLWGFENPIPPWSWRQKN